MFHVKHSTHMNELKSCPVCGSTSIRRSISSRDYFLTGEPFNIDSCDDCGFLFTNPRPEEKVLGNYYRSDEYISHSNTGKGIVNKAYKLVRNHSLARKVKLIRKQKGTGRVLDIGCGTGHFLNRLSKTGFQVTGVEPGPEARAFATGTFQLDVREDIFGLDHAREKFDVITLWHVLEHVFDLNRHIHRMNELLAPDGLVVVAVPNPESHDALHYGRHWAAWDLPRHLYHFSPSSLQLLFNNHGFQVVKTIPMKFDSFYVSLLSEKYRSGRNNYSAAFLTGLRSNLKARGQKKNYSSLIYLLKRKN